MLLKTCIKKNKHILKDETCNNKKRKPAFWYSSLMYCQVLPSLVLWGGDQDCNSSLGLAYLIPAWNQRPQNTTKIPGSSMNFMSICHHPCEAYVCARGMGKLSLDLCTVPFSSVQFNLQRLMSCSPHQMENDVFMLPHNIILNSSVGAGILGYFKTLGTGLCLKLQKALRVCCCYCEVG